MFTGIVEELGEFESIVGDRVRIRADRVIDRLEIGESIAVNGCCLTVVAFGPGWWEADVSEETRRRTSLGDQRPGMPVNLERALRWSDRVGGHLVQGHVDGVGHVVVPVPDLRVSVPDQLVRYLVEKGSVTVDGVSLTVVDVLADGFTAAIIPHTSEVTTLGQRRAGDTVNIEVDITAKYIERMLEPHLHRLNEEPSAPS